MFSSKTHILLAERSFPDWYIIHHTFLHPFHANLVVLLTVVDLELNVA